jgi:PAS domain S-box-containing protein
MASSRNLNRNNPASPTVPLGAASRIIGDGENARLIRSFDWSATPLGPVATWPDTLVTTVNMLLATRHPMFLWWGPDLIQFYNDGYRPSIRDDKHPAAIGQRGAACWPEIWPIIGPQIDAVMSRGESSWNINQLVPINRDGKLEEVYWTYSYSPVRDNDGTVQGTLVVCSETTEPVLSERRLRALLAITLDSPALGPSPEPPSLLCFAQAMVRLLADDPADIPFAALYLLDHGEIIDSAVSASGGPSWDPLHWPLATVVNSQVPARVENLQARLSEIICPPWPEPVTSAYVLPLRLPLSSLQAILVAGLSPRLPFDHRYETFLQLVATRIAGLLQSEIHQMELAKAAKRFSSLVEANPFGMVIGDLGGQLNYVNPAFLQTLGYTPADVGAGRVRWDTLTPAEFADADTRAVQQLRTAGRCDVYEKVYVASDGRRVPILIGASTISHTGGDREVAAFVTDLTPLKIAQEALRKANDELEKKVVERTGALETEVSQRKRIEMSLRELTGRLLRTQDEERRHMARELHDHAGQALAALGMHLSALRTLARNQEPRVISLAAECQQLAENLSKEIRTLSYLLHPPLLDEVGLESALRWYVDGFSERSQIKVDLELQAEPGKLSKELELVIFRVVQESLTNIHRHSGSSSARIYMASSPDTIEFEISDRGKGISPEKQHELTAARAGVGVRGMEERVRQFGGTLQLSSDQNGTKVRVTLPVAPDAA